MKLTLSTLFTLFLVSLSTVVFSQEENTEKTDKEDWVNLLADDSFDQWRSTKKDKTEAYTPIGTRWEINDGVMSLDRSREGTGKHIETKKNYFNFELKFEFNIKHNCNSGIKYRCKNAVGFEFQIMDDANYKDNKVTHRTGEIYELAAEQTPRIVKPAGEWNTGRIIANNNTIEHWLNGKKVCTIEYGGDDWQKRFEKSKYFKKGTLDFGTHQGPIHIQDHSDTDIEIKNLFIREIKTH